MGIVYTDPPDQTAEEPVMKNSKDECTWKEEEGEGAPEGATLITEDGKPIITEGGKKIIPG